MTGNFSKMGTEGNKPITLKGDPDMLEKLGLQAFKDQLAHEMKRALPTINFPSEPGQPEDIIVIANDQNPHIHLRLENLYREYLNSGDFEGIASRLLSTVGNLLSYQGREPDAAKNWRWARTRLVLGVRNVDGRTQENSLSFDLPYPGLILVAMIDMPTYLLPATSDHADAWAESGESILETARRNTAHRIARWERTVVRGRNVWIAADCSGVANCAIALEETLSQLPVNPRRLWVAAPCRDMGIAFEGGSPDEDWFVAHMASRISELFLNRDHPVSPCIYRLREMS